MLVLYDCNACFSREIYQEARKTLQFYQKGLQALIKFIFSITVELC